MPAADAKGILLPVLLFSAPFVFLNFGLPVQTRAMGASALAIGGLFSIFTVTLLVLRPFVGWAMDRFGRRLFFLAAGAFYVAAMLLFGLVDSLPGLYVARLVQGMGAALMWVAARTMFADTSAGQRGQAMGGLAQASVRGSMIGAFWGFTLVGMLPEREAWQLAFLGYAGLAVLACWFAWRRTPETLPERVPGAAPDFAWRELVRVPPQLRLLMGLVCITGFAAALIGPLYLILLQDRFQAHWLILAAAFFPAGIVYGVLQAPMGRWVDRGALVPVLAGGFALAGLVSLALPFLGSLLLVALVYTLFAVGGSMTGPAEAALVGNLAGADNRGRSFGWYEFAASLGASVGPLVGGWLYDRVDPAAPFLLNGVLLLLAAVLAWYAFRGIHAS